jgi:hypothetical protein
MCRTRVDGLTVRVDGSEMPCDTRSVGIGGDIFVLSTAVPSLGLTMHSSYHGHEGLETVIVRMTLAPGSVHETSDRIARAEIPVTHARDRCLLDHVAQVRDAVHARTNRRTTVEIDDATLFPISG